MRLLVLAHDQFGPVRAKTGFSVLRYAKDGWSGDEVVAIVDRALAGRDAGEVAGRIGEGVPCVASVEDALSFQPEGLVIGIAPIGGALPAEWMDDIRTALRNGMAVISGLHTALGRDKELAALAAAHGGSIRDVRYEHPPQRIANGAGLGVDALVVLLVGTDCASGKMTAAIELTKEARARGIRAAFVATGQTGIMVGCESGAPIDALVSDFVAGAVEQCVLEAASGRSRRDNATGEVPDIIFVEGQGSLSHPAYGGVSASLLHGSFPDVLVMADEPSREVLSLPPATLQFVKNTPARERDLNESLLKLTSRARVAAAALMTRGLSDEEYRREAAAIEQELGAPTADVFREGAGRILDGVLAEARRRGLWDDNGLIRGVKPRRAKGDLK